MALEDIIMGGASASSAALPVPQTTGITPVNARTPPAETKRKRNLWDIVGRVADAVAIAGGSAPSYRQNQQRFRAEQAAETARLRAEAKRMQQENAFATIRANPQDQGGYIDLAASGYEKAPDFYKSLNPQDQSMVNQPEVQRLIELRSRYGEGSKEQAFIDMRLGQLGGQGVQYVKDGQGGIYAAPKGQMPGSAGVQQVVAGQPKSNASDFQIVQTPDGYASVNKITGAVTPVDAATMPRGGGAAGKPGPGPQTSAALLRTIVGDLRDSGKRLNQAGGITGSGSSVVDRVGAAAYQNVPFLERVVNQPGRAARADIEAVINQNMLSLIPILTGVTLGGKNFDAAAELKFWQNALTGSMDDYDAYQRNLLRFERRIASILDGSAAPKTGSSARASQGSGRPGPAQRQNSGPSGFRRDPKTGELVRVR